MKKRHLLTTLFAAFLVLAFCRIDVSAVTGSGSTSSPYVLTESCTIPTSWKTSGTYTYFKIDKSSTVERSVSISGINQYNCYYCVTDSSSFPSSGYTGATSISSIATGNYCYLRITNSSFTGTITLTLKMKCTTCLNTLTSDKVHDSSHTTYGYISNGSSQHYKYCKVCESYGHKSDASCAQANLENHTLIQKTIDGVVYNVCQYCGYKESTGVCIHSSFDIRSGRSTSEYCGAVCTNCLENITSIKKITHTWGSRVDSADGHSWTCSKCGYTKTEYHKYVKSYKICKNYYDSILGTIDNSYGHNEVQICSVCGKTVANATTYKHTFNGWKCTQCGYSKGSKLAAPKISSAKQTGSKKVKKYTTAGYWKKIANKWYWFKAKKHTSYTYKVKVKYKKVSGAKAYIVSTKKLTTGGDAYNEKKGLTQTISYSSVDKKLKKITVYVAAVNNKGIVGSVKKITVKVK